MKRLSITPECSRWLWSTLNILQAEDNLEYVRGGLITREMRVIWNRNEGAYRQDEILAQQTDKTITQEDFVVVRIFNGRMAPGGACFGLYETFLQVKTLDHFKTGTHLIDIGFLQAQEDLITRMDIDRVPSHAGNEHGRSDLSRDTDGHRVESQCLTGVASQGFNRRGRGTARNLYQPVTMCFVCLLKIEIDDMNEH